MFSTNIKYFSGIDCAYALLLLIVIIILPDSLDMSEYKVLYVCSYISTPQYICMVWCLVKYRDLLPKHEDAYYILSDNGS
jgi:hypothetical protein